MQELGVPYNNDFNDGEQHGVGVMQYTIGNSQRCDVVKALIKPIEKRENLKNSKTILMIVWLIYEIS